MANNPTFQTEVQIYLNGTYKVGDQELFFPIFFHCDLSYLKDVGEMKRVVGNSSCCLFKSGVW